MDYTISKVANRAIASVHLPIAHFVETGLYDPNAVPGYDRADISEVQVRRVCRQVAKDLKRPFIQCYSYMQTGHHVPDGVNAQGYPKSKYVELDAPRFASGIFYCRKAKYLAPLVAPLLLLNDDEIARSGVGWNSSGNSFWQYQIKDHQLWTSFYEHVLNDPDCRKARGLTT